MPAGQAPLVLCPRKLGGKRGLPHRDQPGGEAGERGGEAVRAGGVFSCRNGELYL